MTNKLIVTEEIEINASKDKVWEVLINPGFIKQWDDIPENYPGGHLQLGSVIEWEGYSKMTVTELDKFNKLKMSLFLPKVDLAPSLYDVNYVFCLTEEKGNTILNIEIGDFATLPKANDYYEASLEWGQTAKQKIKDLAENLP